MSDPLNPAKQENTTAPNRNDSATRNGWISFVLALAGMATGIATGIAIPATTQPGLVPGYGGASWTQRIWTSTTEVTMWSGFAVTVVLCGAALAFGFVGRRQRSLTDPNVDPATKTVTMTLKPGADLGIILALIAPLVVFVAETISMVFVQLLS